jgi:adenine/guanine phosphoribosyltransferase-like PRPP-binding protein
MLTQLGVYRLVEGAKAEVYTVVILLREPELSTVALIRIAWDLESFRLVKFSD